MMHDGERQRRGYSPDRVAPPVQGRQHRDRTPRRLTATVGRRSLKSQFSGKSVEAGDPLIVP